MNFPDDVTLRGTHTWGGSCDLISAFDTRKAIVYLLVKESRDETEAHLSMSQKVRIRLPDTQTCGMVETAVHPALFAFGICNRIYSVL